MSSVWLMQWETWRRIDINIWKLPQGKKILIVNVVGGDDLPIVCKKDEARKESNQDADKEREAMQCNSQGPGEQNLTQLKPEARAL